MTLLERHYLSWVDYGFMIINLDIPTKGSGLGSSGSFLVGLLNAIHTLEGNHVSSAVTNVSSHIEMVLCGKPLVIKISMPLLTGNGVKQLKFIADNGHNIKAVPIKIKMI